MSDNTSLSRLEQSLVGDSKKLSTTDQLLRDSDVVMLLVDTSSSMGGSPIEDLRKVVNDINPRANGIPMIAFGGPYDAQVRFVDIVPDPDGGTPLHIAIPMAKQYGATRIVIISDGCPDLPQQSDEEAKTAGMRIDVVYIGQAGDAGEFFLRNLANMTGGTCGAHDIKKTKEISGVVMGLLEGEVDPAAKIIVAGADGAEVTDIDVSDTDYAEVEAENDDDDDEEDDDEEDDDEDDDEE